MSKQEQRQRILQLPKGIRRRANGKFIAEISHNGVRRSETVNTIEEAIEAKKRILEELVQIHQEKSEVTDSWTLQEALDMTEALQWRGLRSCWKAVETATEAVKFFGPETPISKITTEAVDRYILFLEGPERRNSDSTINRKLSSLSVVLKLAHKRKKITVMPELSRRKEREGRIRFLTAEEERQLIGWFMHIGKPDHAEACVVLIDTGFRCSELWELAAHSVNHVNRTVTVWQTKADKPRTIPMTKRVYDIIARRCEEHPTGQLFPDASNDWLIHGWRTIRRLMSMGNDPDFVPHALRHTCCSRLVQRGVPLNHVQTWMGHKVIQTTLRYSHLAPHDLFALAHVLDGGDTARWQTVAPLTSNE